jgi:hypothetical protein
MSTLDFNLAHDVWSRMARRSGVDVCGVRLRCRLSFLLGIHAPVFQVEIFVILTHEKECIG